MDIPTVTSVIATIFAILMLCATAKRGRTTPIVYIIPLIMALILVPSLIVDGSDAAGISRVIHLACALVLSPVIVISAVSAVPRRSREENWETRGRIL